MQIFDAALAGNISAQKHGSPGGNNRQVNPGSGMGGFIRLAVVLALVGVIAGGVVRGSLGANADRVSAQSCAYGEMRTCLD
jgi:hypothetical protein